MVREVPDYAEQYLMEHPEIGPPLSPRGAGAPAKEAGTTICSADIPVRDASACSADIHVRAAATKATVQIKAQAAPQAAKQTTTQEVIAAEPPAKRRPNPAPPRKPCHKTRKQPISAGEKDPAGTAGTRTQASAGRNRRRRTRQLARPPHRLRIRRHLQTGRRCSFVNEPAFTNFFQPLKMVSSPSRAVFS